MEYASRRLTQRGAKRFTGVPARKRPQLLTIRFRRILDHESSQRSGKHHVGITGKTSLLLLLLLLLIARDQLSDGKPTQ